MQYGMGFILTMNATAFRSGMRSAAASVKGFEATSVASMRRIQAHQSAIAGYGRSMLHWASALYVGVAAIKALTGAAGKFDYQARALSAIMKTNVEDGRAFHKQVLNLNKSMKEFSATEITQVGRALAQAGYDMTGARGLGAVSAILDSVTASMGALSVEAATELGINLERGFGRGIRGMRELLDVSVEGANMFPMTMDKITMAMGYATESAVTYNQSLESVIISLGALMPVVKTASKAGVAYRNTLAALVKPKTVAFMEKHGIKARDADTGEYRNALDIVADIDKAMQPLRQKDMKTGGQSYEAQLHKMFGIRGKSLFAAYQLLPKTTRGPGNTHFKSSTEAYAYLKTQLMGSAGAAAELADKMRFTTEVIDKRFNTAFNSLAISMGKGLEPVVNQFKIHVATMVETMAQGFGIGQAKAGKLGEGRGGFFGDFFKSFISTGILSSLLMIVVPLVLMKLAFAGMGWGSRAMMGGMTGGVPGNTMMGHFRGTNVGAYGGPTYMPAAGSRVAGAGNAMPVHQGTHAYAGMNRAQRMGWSMMGFMGMPMQYAQATASTMGINQSRFFSDIAKQGKGYTGLGKAGASGWTGLAVQSGLASNSKEASKLAGSAAGRSQIRAHVQGMVAQGGSVPMMAGYYGPTGAKELGPASSKTATHVRHLGSALGGAISALGNLAMGAMMLYQAWNMMHAAAKSTSDELYKGAKAFRSHVEGTTKTGDAAIKPFIRWLGLGKEITEEERFQLRRSGSGRFFNVMEAAVIEQKERGEIVDPYKAFQRAVDTQKATLDSSGYFAGEKGKERQQAWRDQTFKMRDKLQQELYLGLIETGKMIPAELRPYAKIIRQKYADAGMGDTSDFFPVNPMLRLGKHGTHGPYGKDPSGRKKGGGGYLQSRTKAAYELYRQGHTMLAYMAMSSEDLDAAGMSVWGALSDEIFGVEDASGRGHISSLGMGNRFEDSEFGKLQRFRAQNTRNRIEMPTLEAQSQRLADERKRLGQAVKQGVVEGIQAVNQGSGMKVVDMGGDLKIVIEDETNSRTGGGK